MTALWALLLGTRPEAPLLGPEAAMRFGTTVGRLVGVGMVGVLVLGIWLAIDVDGYELWDGWILASVVLWALTGWAGAQTGRAFERDPVGGRGKGIRYHALTSIGVLVLLVLMIWKPGA